MNAEDMRDLIANIKERFQLALLISIFFPTLLATYFTATFSITKTPPDDIAHTVLSWSILLAIYLSSYVIFDAGRNPDMREGLLKWLNRMMLVGIAFFIYPIFYLIIFSHTPAATGPEWAIGFDVGSFFVSLWGMQIIPAAVFILSILAVTLKKKNKTMNKPISKLGPLLEESHKINEGILMLLAEKNVAHDTKTILMVAYLDIALEHHKAIMLLIRNQLYGSASALARPILESLFRALWVCECATPEQIEKIANDDSFEFPREMIKEIDEKYKGNGFFAGIKKQSWKAMSGYSHPGLLAIGRRFTGSVVQPNYDEAELMEVLGSTTTATLMLARLIFMANNFDEEVKATEKMMVAYSPKS